MHSWKHFAYTAVMTQNTGKKGLGQIEKKYLLFLVQQKIKK